MKNNGRQKIYAHRQGQVNRRVLAEQSDRSYYAHSIQGTDEQEWQPLLEHLLSTANLARQFGADAGVGELAHTAALFHDIGKYSRAFQARLRGSHRLVDHASAGAREISKLFPDSPYAQLLAYCIAGHHSGLPDYGHSTDLRNEPTLYARLEKRKLEDYSAYRTEIDPSILKLPPVALRPAPSHPGFTGSFMVRMIFSALVDADWIDTETFLEGKRKPRGGHPDLTALLERLERYLLRFGLPANELNREREGILKAGISQASLPPGFFTLTVPTGGGKTLASLAFALHHAVRHGLRRIIYVIPYISIIEQNAAVFAEALGEENVLEHHSNFDWERYSKSRKFPGGGADDYLALEKMKLASENWDIPIVVTTNVQFFESLFSNKKSRVRKVHNIARSVIIFDEAQMLPREYLKLCMLALWELVENYDATAVFCTATQPIQGSFLPKTNITELAPNPRESFASFRRVQVAFIGRLTDEDLAARLNTQQQVLCVVNTRRHAQGLFARLQGKSRHHLSTLMCPAHRAETLSRIREQLALGRSCRVISTQVIEAGVDLDFPVGYRALAGLDSIIQAAGRVNREGRALRGRLYVFEPQTDLIRQLPAYIAQTARAGASVLCEFPEDPFSPQAIRAYFELLGTLQDPRRSALAENILRLLDKENIEFARASEHFRLIEAPKVTILIPYGPGAEDLLADLRTGDRPAHLLRLLQRYSVNIYEREFAALLRQGAIDTYHERFHVLKDTGYYHPQTGLILPDERDTEGTPLD